MNRVSISDWFFLLFSLFVFRVFSDASRQIELIIRGLRSTGGGGGGANQNAVLEFFDF